MTKKIIVLTLRLELEDRPEELNKKPVKSWLLAESNISGVADCLRESLLEDSAAYLLANEQGYIIKDAYVAAAEWDT